MDTSIQNLIQLYTKSFMYFILLAWWSSAVKTCCQINDIEVTGWVDSILFLLLSNAYANITLQFYTQVTKLDIIIFTDIGSIL